MAITTISGFIAAAKQRVPMTKTASRTTLTAMPYSLIDLAGDPGAGTLAGSSTTAGVVPDDTTTGFPRMTAFGGGNTGYLAAVEYNSSVACTLALFDLLWKGGAFSFATTYPITSPPSFAGRIPDSDYSTTELWIEQVTAGTGYQNVNITYTNQDGTASRSTGTVAAPVVAAPVGRMWQVPLQAGDSGVQAISNIVGSVATAGTFNVLVMRRLWTGRVPVSGGGGIDDLFKTGMPKVFDTSALFLMTYSDVATSGIPCVIPTIVNG